jgi:pimeloyl-ACP methyl ester carboxylesterase
MAQLRTSVNGIEIAYETFGVESNPRIVLVMGLGTQSLAWPEGFCRALAGRGFHVVRFDNRDIGGSTHLDAAPVPNPVAAALLRRRIPYRLEDLAADTIAFIAALGPGPVHLVGASMGGFIAQLVALQAPELISSLTLIMTSTGSRRVGLPSPRLVAAVLRTKPAGSKDEAVAASLAMFALIGSPGYVAEKASMQALAEQSYDRGYNPAGNARQLAAVVAQTDRTKQLARLAVPTLVMHGLHDPLVAPNGGLALAQVIPGARFVGFHGMGHDLPAQLWPDFVEEIVAVTERASR